MSIQAAPRQTTNVVILSLFWNFGLASIASKMCVTTLHNRLVSGGSKYSMARARARDITENKKANDETGSLHCWFPPSTILIPTFSLHDRVIERLRKSMKFVSQEHYFGAVHGRTARPSPLIG